VRRRADAARLVAAGRVRRNGVRILKPHQPVRPGDVLTLTLARRVLLLRIVALGARRGPAREARGLYELLEGSDEL